MPCNHVSCNRESIYNILVSTKKECWDNDFFTGALKVNIIFTLLKVIHLLPRHLYPLDNPHHLVDVAD